MTEAVQLAPAAVRASTMPLRDKVISTSSWGANRPRASGSGIGRAARSRAGGSVEPAGGGVAIDGRAASDVVTVEHEAQVAAAQIAATIAPDGPRRWTTTTDRTARSGSVSPSSADPARWTGPAVRTDREDRTDAVDVRDATASRVHCPACRSAEARRAGEGATRPVESA